MKKIEKNKYLTLEDLGKFTEDVLLPAIGSIIDEKLEIKLEEKLEEKLELKLEQKLEVKLEEKLDHIKQHIFSIKEDLKRLEIKIDRMSTANSGDVVVLNKDIIFLKKRVGELEKEVRILKNRK